MMFYTALTLCLVAMVHHSSSELITNHLKIALVDSDPFCIKDSNGNARGFLVDLMQDLLHRVNTSGTQSVTYETFWVTLDRAATEAQMWDAVRQKLVGGQADMALVPLADTKGWNGVVQLTQPYLLTPFVPVTMKQTLVSPERGSILDKLRKGQAKALYVSGSAMAGLIDNDDRSPIKNLRESLTNSSQVPTYDEGLSRVLNQPDHTLISERLALFGEELRMKQFLLQSTNCDLVFDWDSTVALGGYTLPLSLYVQSQPLVSAINMNLLRMRQDGTVARLKTKWWHAPVSAPCRPPETGAGILGNLENYY